MGYRVAVVGATGNVGREMLQTLAERSFPVDEVVALASSARPAATSRSARTEVLKVQRLDTFNFKGIDIVLSSAGAKISADFAPARRGGRRRRHRQHLAISAWTPTCRWWCRR